MSKTAEEILAEAPVSRYYGFKVAFTCPACPWWCHDWNTPKKAPDDRLLCGACGQFLKELPLEVLIQTTRTENPTHFEAFIKANAANTGVREEPDDRAEG